MLLVDTVQGRIIDDDELKETYAARQPYGEWLDRNLIHLQDLPIPNKRVDRHTPGRSWPGCRRPSATPMRMSTTPSSPWHETGAEPTAAMGVDIPLAVLDPTKTSPCSTTSSSSSPR